MTVLGFTDASTLVGHFVSSPREREKRDRRDSRRDERGRCRTKCSIQFLFLLIFVYSAYGMQTLSV